MAETKTPSAREIAVTALARARRGARPDEALEGFADRQELSRRDFALASRIVMGVVQNMYLLDFYISEYSTIKPEKMEPRLLDILRAGAYQIVFLDRVPSRAAVNESVELAKKSGFARASGLVNAVLRRLSEAVPGKLPEIAGEGTAEHLSVKYSHPLWLTEEFISELGYEDAEAFVRMNNESAPLTAQVNPLKTGVSELIEALRSEGTEALPHPWLADCIEIQTSGSPAGLAAFKNGEFYIQDAAARFAVSVAGIEPGMHILDCCAAPGGKSFASAIAAENKGYILSCDLSKKKLSKITEGARRLGIDIIETRAMDAREPPEELFGAFDVVIADVPCSGFGVIRRKPEIRYKDKNEIERLPEIQAAILKSISACVKPGGILIYSTCTTRKEENREIAERFLAESPEFVLENITSPEPAESGGGAGITLYPHLHGTDGFYICKMRKSGI